MNYTQRTMQEYRTTLTGAAVLAEAKRFFSSNLSLYAAFIDMEGPTFCSFRGQGGEEIVIGVSPADAGSRVTGSTYLFDGQVARFFSTLPPLVLEKEVLEAAKAAVAS